MTRRKTTGKFSVSGPYEAEHAVPSVGAGVSCALTFANRHRAQEGELSYYVRDLAGRAFARVTKREDGVILAYELSGGSGPG